MSVGSGGGGEVGGSRPVWSGLDARAIVVVGLGGGDCRFK